MKVLQINSVINWGSTGRIAEELGNVLISNGIESYIAFGRNNKESNSIKIRIGNKLSVLSHYLISTFYDKHGLGTKWETKKFIEKIESLKPDVIILHNLHGYYVNYEILFDFIAKSKIPTIWTLHDCWAFTGHCTFFDSVNCEKWKSQCNKCPKTKFYPSAFIADSSNSNFDLKKKLFNTPINIQLITPSNWLKNLVEQSFLKHKTETIFNGVDINVFKIKTPNQSIIQKYRLENKKIILGVASIWDKRKGMEDCIKLFNILELDSFQIILIGLNKRQLKELPKGIIGIERTENVNELADYYSLADVYINPTWQDNFPTTNIEALACGTPVITYDTGGSVEAVDKNTGYVVKKGDIIGLSQAIIKITANKKLYSDLCRERAVKFFNKDQQYIVYLNLINSMINGK